MRINLSFAELSHPLFCGGKNFGLKLDTKNLPGLELVYDRNEKELWIKYNGKLAIIPTASNVTSMTPKELPGFDGVFQSQQQLAPQPLPTEPDPEPETQKAQRGRPPKIKAQVSGPTAHVFEGPGHGQTGVNLGVTPK